MEFKSVLQQLIDRQDLTLEVMQTLMRQIMAGELTSAQLSAVLIALRMKGETVTELLATAQVMRELMTPVEMNLPYLVDTCGTGGDGLHLFNVSTASAIVAAAAGAKVAKHGNRSVSSTSGSADVLEVGGINLNLTPAQIARCVESVGVGFLFAPAHHGAMKHAIAVRRELGVRTLFNLVGPLTNPARVPRQVLGVFSRHWVRPLAEVLKGLNSQHALVVHAADGLDEISIAAPTYVAELKDGEIHEYEIRPEDFGITSATDLTELTVSSAQESFQLIQSIFGKKSAGPAKNIVLLNAGAAIYVSGVASSLQQGIRLADDILCSGLAKEKWETLANFTQVFAVSE